MPKRRPTQEFPSHPDRADPAVPVLVGAVPADGPRVTTVTVGGTAVPLGIGTQKLNTGKIVLLPRLPSEDGRALLSCCC
jgi:hypothetical protein